MLNPFVKNHLKIKQPVFREPLPSANIVLVFDRLVGGKTKKTGRAVIALCPFHGEDTPSFALYEDTNSFYCFGCQKSGDVYEFVKELKEVDFQEALKIIETLT